jgi:hypothetical protein
MPPPPEELETSGGPTVVRIEFLVLYVLQCLMT